MVAAISWRIVDLQVVDHKILKEQGDARSVLHSPIPAHRGFFFFQAEDGIRVHCVTGVQTCALPILLRLGVDLGLMPEEYRATIDELFIRTQPAHLQKDFERKLTTEERDGLRSDLLRERLKQVHEPNTKSLSLAKPDADKKNK